MKSNDKLSAFLLIPELSDLQFLLNKVNAQVADCNLSNEKKRKKKKQRRLFKMKRNRKMKIFYAKWILKIWMILRRKIQRLKL